MAIVGAPYPSRPRTLAVKSLHVERTRWNVARTAVSDRAAPARYLRPPVRSTRLYDDLIERLGAREGPLYLQAGAETKAGPATSQRSEKTMTSSTATKTTAKKTPTAAKAPAKAPAKKLAAVKAPAKAYKVPKGYEVERPHGGYDLIRKSNAKIDGRHGWSPASFTATRPSPRPPRPGTCWAGRRRWRSGARATTRPQLETMPGADLRLADAQTHSAQPSLVRDYLD